MSVRRVDHQLKHISYSSMTITLPHITLGFFLLLVSIASPVLAVQNEHSLEDIEARLRKLNKRAVKTIQSPDGDVIDCVLSNIQPAFDHPALRGKKPLDPPNIADELDKTNGSSPEPILQTWMVSGESCPQGSIPIRRTTKRDLLRANSMASSLRTNVVQQPPGSDFYKEYSYALLSGGTYYGATATVNVWKPFVASSVELSSAQIWISAGSKTYEYESIEVGWQVYQTLYGDNLPRLFIYWTGDSYKEDAGCYNLDCAGFVQTNKSIVLGGSLAPSVYGGAQSEITIGVWKDPTQGNWWLSVNGHKVGYWPSSIFNLLSSYATKVEFGGGVAYKDSTSHTSTYMGSGHLASEGEGKAAHFRNVQIVNSNNSLYYASLDYIADKEACYDIAGGTRSDWGISFFYGGPGWSTNCP